MSDHAFDPKDQRVTTQWYCAFGKRPLVQVFVLADGVPTALRLAAKLDTVDGIEEARVAVAELATALPSATEFNLVGELVVPAAAAVRPFCVGVICVLTALWTQALTLDQLAKAEHPQAPFYRHAMHVLGCDSPLGHVVSGSADPPDPKYDWF